MVYLLTIVISMIVINAFHRIYSHMFSVRNKVDIYPKPGRFSLDINHLKSNVIKTSDQSIKRNVKFLIFMEYLSGYLFLLCVLSVIVILIFAIF
jgi:hypothetical protein